ncbi:translocation/assembly module TamB domain-containing protein [Aquabacterium sp.]|uniref:translocation/assembly module TamB domain-containing protein n=1 Tax=Aquabacterium sp. TaxID=1872578 RepID=UPI003B6F066F
MAGLRRVGWLRALLRGMATLLMVPLLAILSLWALAHTEWFTQWVVPRIPGITVTEPRGALVGDFSAQRLVVHLPRGGTLLLQDTGWSGMQIYPSLDNAWHVGLTMSELRAQKLDLHWVADTQAPASSGPPQDVALPLSIHTDRLRVDVAHSDLWGGELQNVVGVVSLQAGVLPVEHRIQLQSLTWQGWQLAGQGQIGVSGPMPVKLALRATSAWPDHSQGTLNVALRGPLSDLHIQASGVLQPAQRGSQSLDLEGRLQPFAAWPVSALKAYAKALDLSQLLGSLPRTSLSGVVEVAPVQTLSPTQRAPSKPGSAGVSDLGVRISVRNADARSWDQHGLPVLGLSGGVTLHDVSRLKTWQDVWAAALWDLHAALPTNQASRTATLGLSGSLHLGNTLRIALDGVEPQALHARAPALQLQGQIKWTPDALDPSTPALSVEDLRGALDAQLNGRYGAAYAQAPLARSLRGGLQDVSLAFSAHKASHALKVTAMRMASGAAQATLQDAELKWGEKVGPTWTAAGLLKVAQFDPQVWLPWPAGMAGKNHLSGDVQFKVDANWRGELSAHLLPSMLAGVPVSGEGHWSSPAGRQRMQSSLTLDVAGNALQGELELPWRLGPQQTPQIMPGMRWAAKVQAPALSALQPLAPMLAARRLAGQVNLSASGVGQWPRWVTSGQGTVSGLEWQADTGGATLSLQQAKGEWQVDMTQADAQVRAAVGVKQLRAGAMRLDQADITLGGRTQDHHGQVLATLTQTGSDSASAAAIRTFNIKAGVQGNLLWRDDAQGWQGEIQDVAVQVLRAGESLQRQALLMPRASLDWRQDAKGERLRISPTTLQFMGADLKLNKLDWFWPDRNTDVVGQAEASLELAPFNLPALLNRWQPEAGWGGDLMLTGQLNLKHSQQQPWVVDAVVMRQTGDVTLSEATIEGNTAQHLGIREAKLSLQSRHGVWTLDEILDGRLLGTLVGHQVVQTQDARQLPGRDDALVGSLDFKIGNLRPLGTWLPAGWRMSGQMLAQAKLAGTLGAPQYQGQVSGESLGLAQTLMGVNLTDGRLQMTLQGSQIQLQNLQMRAGPQGGWLTAQGEATLGAQPQASVRIKADRFQALQRVDRRVMLSGEVAALLTGDDLRAEGQVHVDEGLIDISKGDAPVVGDDVYVLNRPGSDEAAVEASGGGRSKSQRKVSVALDVDLGEQLRLKGRGLDALLTGHVKVTTPANRPSLQGTIKAEKGTFAAYGQKLVIERGAISFTGAIENPRLDILAMRPQSASATASDVKVGVTITGTAQDPRIRLYSDPSMSETEKLSWLVLGRAPTGLGGADIGLLQSAAVALLSGEGASPTDNLIGLLGLDELSVKQTEGTVRDTVVNVGKQVSRYWYVGYERNLNATGGNWQLIYRLAQRFTLRAQAGVDNAVDLIWSWRWD